MIFSLATENNEKEGRIRALKPERYNTVGVSSLFSIAISHFSSDFLWMYCTVGIFSLFSSIQPLYRLRTTPSSRYVVFLSNLHFVVLLVPDFRQMHSLPLAQRHSQSPFPPPPFPFLFLLGSSLPDFFSITARLFAQRSEEQNSLDGLPCCSSGTASPLQSSTTCAAEF